MEQSEETMKIGSKTLSYAIMAVHAAVQALEEEVASTGDDSLPDLQTELLGYSNAATELKQEYVQLSQKYPDLIPYEQLIAD